VDPNPPLIFHRALYRARRARAAATAGDVFLAHEAAAHLASRIAAVNREFARGLDLHSRAAVFPALRACAREWVRCGDSPDRPDLIADDEALPFAAESFDLAVSVLSLHAVNDLPGTLIQIRRALKPDGLFVGALFAGDTLNELRQAFAAAEAETLGGASPRVASFADVRELGGLLQRAGFALSVADVERTTVRYRDPARLFADLRALGETNVLTGRRANVLSRRTLAALVRGYWERFADGEHRLPATFDIVFLTGWSPHESQPKPLRPGSAQARLIDALVEKQRTPGGRAI
jgi:SAM-dependent methyltransferase